MLQIVTPDAITVANPRVRIIAARCRWHSSTLVRRVLEALPAPIEQKLYLRLAETIRVRPESVAAILRELLGSRELQDRDLLDMDHGKGLVSNRFAETLDLVTETLSVTHVLKQEYGNVAIQAAARLVRSYGPDHVETVLDSLVAYLGDCGFSNESPKRQSLAISWFCRDGLDLCDARGIPYPNDVSDWIATHPHARRSLHNYIGYPR